METTLIAAFLGYVFGFAVSGWLSSGRDPGAGARLAALERKVELLLDHFNVERDRIPSDVDQLLASGRKIEAIKAYRYHTGLGLKESKDAVEARERYLRGPAGVPPSIQ